MKEITNKEVIPDNDPDSLILEQMLNGNKNRFEIIMRRYNQRLFRIGRSYITDEDEVEDILQASYIKAYENLHTFENRSMFSTWLTKIVINETLSRLNKRNKYNYIDPGDEEENNKLNSLPSLNLNPEEEASNNELKEALEKVIDNLPLKYRTVFVMREIEKMSITETSECLKLTEGNVKVRLNRAKEMLRENLINVYKENEVFSFMGSRCDRIVFNVMNRIK